MPLQESGEMYLESILQLSKSKVNVRSLDVAEFMGYSKASVSRAIGLLKSGDYIKVDSDGYLRLTSKGMSVAEKIYERHTILSSFLISLGVNESIASDDACKIEHHISDESFQAIKQFIKK